MRISTCRYMRNKIKIDIDSPNCIYCTSELETLSHIFIDCPKTNYLVSLLESCLKNSVVKDYRDPYKLYYITCCHENPKGLSRKIVFRCGGGMSDACIHLTT